MSSNPRLLWLRMQTVEHVVECYSLEYVSCRLSGQGTRVERLPSMLWDSLYWVIGDHLHQQTHNRVYMEHTSRICRFRSNSRASAQHIGARRDDTSASRSAQWWQVDLSAERSWSVPSWAPAVEQWGRWQTWLSSRRKTDTHSSVHSDSCSSPNWHKTIPRPVKCGSCNG